MENIKVFIIDLPHRIHGATCYQCESDGDLYIILINARLSYEMQKKALSHEMAHINNHDYDSMYTVDLLESLRHAG